MNHEQRTAAAKRMVAENNAAFKRIDKIVRQYKVMIVGEIARRKAEVSV